MVNMDVSDALIQISNQIGLGIENVFSIVVGVQHTIALFNLFTLIVCVTTFVLCVTLFYREYKTLDDIRGYNDESYFVVKCIIITILSLAIECIISMAIFAIYIKVFFPEYAAIMDIIGALS